MIKLNPLNAFTVIAFISMIICFIAFIYISYRLLFTIIMLVDKKHYDDDKNPMYYIKESFSKTKNIFVFMKFGLIIILLSIFSLPLGVLQDNFSKSLEDIRVYKEYDLL
jgi:membrane-anchored glycerophosphoryl diester phosphodiesterase (GDPDase)